MSLYQQGLINNIRDLIAIRDGTNDVILDNFDSDMIKSMIVNIACDWSLSFIYLHDMLFCVHYVSPSVM